MLEVDTFNVDVSSFDIKLEGGGRKAKDGGKVDVIG